MTTAIPTPTFTRAREEFLEAAQRKNKVVPIRRLFVQQGKQRRPRPGPLAEMVRRHDATALDLYLLALAKATAPVSSRAHGKDVHSVVLHNVVWGRLLADVSASTTTRAWTRLQEEYHLVHRERSGRLMDVKVLNENGKGSDYVRPQDGGRTDTFFKLPFAYWLDPVPSKNAPWVDVLSLPGKAMLLIGLSLKSGFILPVRQAEDWYGLSSDTAQRGLEELRSLDAMDSYYHLKPTSLTPEGFTREYHHTMLPPFHRVVPARRRSKLRAVS
jgi:hypothetical protein